jgi:hypothetical protein
MLKEEVKSDKLRENLDVSKIFREVFKLAYVIVDKNIKFLIR